MLLFYYEKQQKYGIIIKNIGENMQRYFINKNSINGENIIITNKDLNLVKLLRTFAKKNTLALPESEGVFSYQFIVGEDYEN